MSLFWLHCVIRQHVCAAAGAMNEMIHSDTRDVTAVSLDRCSWRGAYKAELVCREIRRGNVQTCLPENVVCTDTMWHSIPLTQVNTESHILSGNGYS